MIAALIATTSSWSRRFSSPAGVSVPRTRIIGKLPTFRCRSDAPLSTAIFSRSLTCMLDGPALAKRRLLVVDKRQPAVRVWCVAVDDVEKRTLQCFRGRTAPPGADLDLVARPARHH